MCKSERAILSDCIKSEIVNLIHRPKTRVGLRMHGRIQYLGKGSLRQQHQADQQKIRWIELASIHANASLETKIQISCAANTFRTALHQRIFAPVVVYDYLIIGQGIAGSTLAMRLLENDQRILVVDHVKKNTASKVAAGIFNPIAGKRFSLAWRVEECFNELHLFYSRLEKKFTKRFLHPMPLMRVVPDFGSQNAWLSRAAEDRYQPYVDIEEPFLPAIEGRFGIMEIHRAGYLDTLTYIQTVGKHLSELGALIRTDEDIDPQIGKDLVRWKDIEARNVVFANGIRAKDHTLFADLPFTPMKGEILDVKCPSPRDRILTGGCFMCPDQKGTFRVGSTYEWRNVNEEITQEARDELTKKLEKYMFIPFEVTDHSAGIRPSVKDRKPMIGQHPEHVNVYLFNGLGSKGVSLAPYLSELLWKKMNDGIDIPGEVDLNRFK